MRARGDFTIQEGIRRLTSHPADLYGIPNRGRLAVGAQADMLLFDPATVGISPAERVADLPGGGRRTIRRPTGVHGVFCNGIKTFDGKDYVKHAKGPGHVLDRFNASARGPRMTRVKTHKVVPRRLSAAAGRAPPSRRASSASRATMRFPLRGVREAVGAVCRGGRIIAESAPLEAERTQFVVHHALFQAG